MTDPIKPVPDVLRGRPVSLDPDYPLLPPAWTMPEADSDTAQSVVDAYRNFTNGPNDRGVTIAEVLETLSRSSVGVQLPPGVEAQWGQLHEPTPAEAIEYVRTNLRQVVADLVQLGESIASAWVAVWRPFSRQVESTYQALQRQGVFPPDPTDMLSGEKWRSPLTNRQYRVGWSGG